MIGLTLFLLLASHFHSGGSQCQRGENGFFSHPQQCDRYIECRNGTTIDGVCPDGLLFNDDASHRRLRCDYPSEVNCGNRQQLQSAKPTLHCPRRWGLFANEQDCGRFWNCVDGHPFDFACPEGLAFNDIRNHCDWPDEVDRCDSATFLGVRCPQEGPGVLSPFENPHIKHDTDCKKHYVCVMGKDGKRHPRLFSCDEGRVFNDLTEVCEPPENVPGCENYYGVTERRQFNTIDGRRRRLL